MSVDEVEVMPRQRGGARTRTLIAVPSEGFSTLAAIEMQTIIRYLQQVRKRADARFLKVIPPEQMVELREVAPYIHAFLYAAHPEPVTLQPGAEPPARRPAIAAMAGRGGWTRGLARKLTDDQVRSIRQRYRAGGETHKALAQEFGVSQTVVCMMLAGTTYRDVPDEPPQTSRS